MARRAKSEQGDSLSPKRDSLSAPKGSPRFAEVETWPIARLQPYDRNARKHSDKQVNQLRRSFKQFGQVWPLLVREDGTIIAGHGRFEAAKAEGFTQVRVIVARDWTAQQCRAFGLLDNKLALNSEWDQDRLSLELADLRGLGDDLDVLGFSEKELSRLLLEPTAAQFKLDAAFQILIECKDEAEQVQL